MPDKEKPLGAQVGNRLIQAVINIYGGRFPWNRRPNRKVLSAAAGAFEMGLMVAEMYPEAAAAVRAYFMEKYPEFLSDEFKQLYRYIATGEAPHWQSSIFGTSTRT